MKTFRDKHFKNKLDPKAVYYDCIRSCELNTSTEQGVENCVIQCTRPLASSEGYRYLKAGLFYLIHQSNNTKTQKYHQ